MNTKAIADIRRKLKVLDYGKEIGNVSKACRRFGVSREAISIKGYGSLGRLLF